MADACVPLLVVTIALAVASLFQFALTRSGGTRAMGPNGLVGIKMASTRRSAGAWIAGHEAAQPGLLAAGVTGLGASVPLGIWIQRSPEPGAALFVACLATAVLVAGLFLYAVGCAHRAAVKSGDDAAE